MNTKTIVGAALAVLVLGACGKQETGPATTAASPAAEISQPKKLVPACKLMTLDEMKPLLGRDDIVATAEDGEAVTRCVWSRPSGEMPTAELKIELGSGEVAMAAFGMLGKMEPGINSPYEGLGDQAVASGPVVMIRRGEDLWSIMVFGAAMEHDAAVRKIYDTAVSRL
jgi:hypothetical protein